MFSHAVVIAGGFGARMMPLTKYVPKPLIEVNGKPLIQHALDFFKKHKIESITVTYGHKHHLLLDYIGSDVASMVNTIDKDNAYFLFNTIVKYIDKPIIVCPCDLIVDIDMEQLYQEYIQLGEPALGIVPIPASANADFIHSKESRVTKITREDISEVCASGIQILNPAKINRTITPKDNFYDVWMELIKAEAMYITQTQPISWKAFDNLKDII